MIGAGISGLAAAWEFAQREPTAEVVVLEAATQTGGKLRLEQVADVTVDVGAEAMLARRPEGLDLLRSVGLGPDLITPLTLSAQVRAGGENRPLPARTMWGSRVTLTRCARRACCRPVPWPGWLPNQTRPRCQR